ncbi:HAD family hydrolase [Luteimicrobium xylanilyticum]|uniref:Sugar-phosphatase n=1 Tax=Luteimicrobium xylanilyticum TaxID=1133546 RepID=A0A5P9QFY7_9MICO|nr:HAD-IA family hydrolase [Luteimicrobium xylanilyticum]QFU99992.1 Sugar-phosphatase [Luteimicrobium xylanilyticum]
MTHPALPDDGARAAALLLDLDGTLVDTTEKVEAAWRWGADRLGVPFSTLEPYVHGIPGAQALELALPGRLDEAERAALTDELLIRMSDPAAGHVRWMPGAQDLVTTLARDAADAWAIVTSGDRRLAGSSVEALGLPLPPVMVTSEDVELGKPHPEPYLRAADALGILEVDACVVVEDAPAGIAAGKAAGMRVLALATTYPASELGDANWVVGSLADVRVTVEDDAIVLRAAG